MRIQQCSNDYVNSMVSMPSSSKEQNTQLAYEIENGDISLHNCIIMIHKTHVVARIVIESNYHYLTYFTIEDISQQEVDVFMEYVTSLLQNNYDWMIDLFSDKRHYHKIRQAIQHFFSIEILRESYIIKPMERKTSIYDFRSAAHICPTKLLNLMVNARKSTLDCTLQREFAQSSLEDSTKETMQKWLEDNDHSDLFQVLWIDNIPVGYICLIKCMKGIYAIHGIGVDARYQGHSYSSILLNKAIDIAYHKHAYKLIGEIDKGNHPIKTNLIRCEFQMDCEQHIFIREKQTCELSEI